MFRPKDWKNPYEVVYGKDITEMTHKAYEAGADAMLEGLKGGSGFRCSVMNITSVYGGSTMSPLEFSLHTQSIVEEKDGATHISLPNFNLPEYQTYPPKRGYLIFIPDEEE